MGIFALLMAIALLVAATIFFGKRFIVKMKLDSLADALRDNFKQQSETNETGSQVDGEETDERRLHGDCGCEYCISYDQTMEMLNAKLAELEREEKEIRAKLDFLARKHGVSSEALIEAAWRRA